MNRKELLIKRRRNWYDYHLPGCGNLKRVKKNVVFISAANSLKHELAKAEVCWLIKKARHEFITEAERNRKRGEARVKVDIVDLDTREEIEIETNKSRAKQLIKEGKATVIKLWEENGASTKDGIWST